LTRQHEFTNTWFSNTRAIWDNLLPKENPKRVLEIGSFEGASACYLIEKIGANQPFELHCVDTWDGGVEHKTGGEAETSMPDVELRFIKNIEISKSLANYNIDIHRYKMTSDLALSKMLAAGRASYFDFIYVDGSHQAPDVLLDAVLAFKLLRVGGVLAFDDYHWNESLPYGVDPIRSPKIAIDAFCNIFCRKVRVLPGGGVQLYARKTAE
jgi:predicted O-methyltransferase YrrM